MTYCCFPSGELLGWLKRIPPEGEEQKGFIYQLRASLNNYAAGS
jgi:hypothetical protein